MSLKRALGILFVLALLLTPVALVAKAVHGGALVSAEPTAPQEPVEESKAGDENDGWRIEGADRDDAYEADDRRPGFLGVEVTSMTPALRRHFGADEDRGVLISEIRADSAAEVAGLEVGDVITRVDGEDIDSSSDLRRAVRRAGAGSAVPVDVLRDGSSLAFEAVLGEAPERVAHWGEARERMARRHAERAREHAARMREHGERLRERNQELADRHRERAERLRERERERAERLRDRSERLQELRSERRDWDEADWEEFGERWAEFGAHWAEWGARFGEHWADWAEDFAMRWEHELEDHGEEWEHRWEIHGEEMERAVEEALEGVDWDQIGRSVEMAMDSIEWDAIGPEMERAMEEAMRALDHLDVDWDDADWDDDWQDRRRSDESRWDDDRDDRLRR